MSVTVLALEGAPARQAFVETATERPDVRAPIDHLPTRLFRAHVGRCPEHHALSSGVTRGDCRFGAVVRCVEGLRQAEVQQLHTLVGRDRDVCRFEVPMDDARVVRRFEPFGDLAADVERFANRRAPCRKRSASVCPGTSSMTRKG